MKDRVTIHDLAKMLHSTPATVSRALNNHPRISAATKKAVNELADKLHYRRNHIASSLRSGKTLTIGVIIPSAGINFFGSVVHGIESLANQHGYKILLYQSNEEPGYEVKAIQAFIGAKVDGMLASVAKASVDVGHYQEVVKRGIPLVLFDRTHSALSMPAVVVDDFKGAYMATEHLAQQGYTRIAHVTGPLHLSNFSNRLKGYKAALAHLGFPFKPDWVFEGDVTIEAGKNALNHFWNNGHRPDAVFAAEDFTALGVLKAARQLTIDIPTALGVAGFANEQFGEHITPSLTTFDQQTAEMGRQAFALLLQWIDNKNTQQPTQTITIDPVLHFRQSTNRRGLPLPEL